MTRCLCPGVIRAKSVVRSAASPSSASDILSTWLPRRTVSVGNPDHLADLAADEIVVAGQDLHGHAVPLERLDRCQGGLLRRVEERHVAREDQIGLVVLRVGLARLEVAVRERQHAEAVATQRSCSSRRSSIRTLSIGIDLVLQLEARAALEDLFRGALADQAVLALGRLHDDRHEPPREVERELVHLAPVGDRDLAVHLVMLRAPRGRARS